MNNVSGVAYIAIITVLFWGYSALGTAPQEKVELKFSHKIHVVDNELECLTCHENAKTSNSGSDNLFPEMSVCGNCHNIESPESCQFCHRDVNAPRAVPRVETYSRLFSHQKHLAAGLECTTCHSEVVQKTSVAPYVLPDMAFCMDCHARKQVSNDCFQCHLKNETLKPASHRADFIHNHADAARMQTSATRTAERCNLCHRSNFCQNCHEGDNLDRTTHPLNYIYTHSLDARGKERECADCHTERSFCNDCHRQNLLMPYDHQTGGWVNQIPGDGGRHRIEAENDLESCMSCHEQNAEITCQRSGCHEPK